MATLFERLIGLNLDEGSQVPSEQKMAIHAFIGSINFVGMSPVTGGVNIGYGDVAGYYDLDTAQQDDMRYFDDLISAAAAAGYRTGFQRAMKDYLYQGEWNSAPLWQDETTFYNTMRGTISDAGGTPPPPKP